MGNMNRNKPGDCFISPREEVGFLLLEECILHFDSRSIQPQTWITVSTKDRDESNEQLIDDNDICLRGNVFLWRKEQTETELSLFLDTKHTRFNGTLCDAYHSSSCGGNCQEGKTSRSDASLLLGLAMSCQDSEFIKIESIQIQLQSDPSQPRYSGNKMNRVSFLITFSMPWLCEQRKTNLKRMSPSSKLLMALMRSDWEYLNTRMKSPTSKRFQPDGLLGSESVFPSKLSLEDLYLRIQGVQIGEKVIRSKALKNSLFSTLPLEIIQEKIAPYLRAGCLYNWQSCCYDLHQALKSVVPGLKLRLYEYQVRSLEWMRKRECQDLSEEDALNGCCDNLSSDGDLHRGLTAGATVLLRTKSFPRKRIRLGTEFGTVLNEGGSIIAAPFGKQNVTRGGLLCDDPGLGKTITVLSLILQTIGLSCESCSSSKDGKSHYNDDAVFGAYWNSLEDAMFKRHDLNRLIKQLKRFDAYGIIPQRSSKRTGSNEDETSQIPSCYEEIMKNIEKNKYVEDFSIFENDIYSMLQSVVAKSSAENGISECDVEDVLSKYKCCIHQFKKTKIDIAKKFCSRSNDAVAGMIKRNNKKELMESLYPSASTLIVVPETLLSHWVQQIENHVDMKYISSKIPATFHFQKNEKALRKEFDDFWKNVIHLKTHSPFLFVDHSSVDLLPEPSFLAKFKIVLTTTKRFSYEWKSGSFESEIRQTDKTDDLDGNLTSELSACSLLKINWTRLVVDEGHSMGRSKHNNAILFASWITANRRWAMTGTPTPQTLSSSGLSNLMGLMGFLKHDFFTAKMDGERFWNSLVRSWNTGSLSAFFQVRSLLSIFMKRHRKLDIPELPPPIFKRVWLDMSIGEKNTFNTLASAVQSNILITGMKAKTSGKQDSLLHKSQSKHARRAFENLRLVCSGGLRVVPQITREAWDETIELLNHHELDNVKMKLILDFMERAVTEQLSHCMACGIGLNTLLIVPCGDLVCTDCMKDNLQVTSKNCMKVRSGNAPSDNDKDFIQVCPICQAEFDADEFQRLQPGIIYEWYDYGKHEEKLKKEMLLDQIEEAGQAEFNRGLAGQVEIQPAVPIRRTRKHGDGHVCTYSKSNGDGRCKYCHEEHDGCVMILENSRCTTCHRVAENCPREESKFHYIISKLDFLQSQVRQKSRSYSPAASSIIGEEIKTEEVRPLKVIIFSQYRKVLNLIGNRLIRRYGPGAISEFWGSYRRKELLKFKNISDCFCMLLSKDGSEGLDISFVTHIFFLEEIWDKSLQDQTVARAWRMGATGRVEVETLLANESVESLMTINDDEGCDSFQRNISEIKRSKMNHILESLRLIGRPSRGLKREVDEHVDTSIPKKKHMVRFRDSV